MKKPRSEGRGLSGAVARGWVLILPLARVRTAWLR